LTIGCQTTILRYGTDYENVMDKTQKKAKRIVDRIVKDLLAKNKLKNFEYLDKLRLMDKVEVELNA